MPTLREKLEQVAVVEFLTRFKSLASEHGIVILEREDYKNTLTELGILPSQAREAIQCLTIADYYKGIGPGEREGEEVCEFGVSLAGEEIYIKLLIDTMHERAICFSFHFAHRPIKHPFADDEG